MTAKLYVGNVAYDASGDDLSTLFGEAGTVLASRIIVDRVTGKSRGFGFVEMASETDAEAAIGRFNGYRLLGRTLLVYLAHDNRELSRRAREAKARVREEQVRQTGVHHPLGMGIERTDFRNQDMRDRLRRPSRHGLLRDRPL